MPHEYLDHEADVGIRGIGHTLAEAMSEAARAMFGIMANLDLVAPKQSFVVHCEAPDTEMLFVEFLNELLFQREMRGMLLSTCHIDELQQGEEGCHLEAEAWGEPLNPCRHEILTEVKAATYSGLRVLQKGAQYVAQCVVDV